MDRVLLRLLQLWDWGGPNSTWLPTDTRWRASPYSARSGGSSSQSAEDRKVSRRGYHTSKISPSRRRSHDWHPDHNLQKIWKIGEWPTTWTKSLVITLPKKGNLQLCQNYRTISLISHPSKVMSKIILNRLQPQAEEITAEEQAGFRAGRSTTEQIFNLRILCEKYLQHQQNLYHVFIDFKNAFDMVWHEALWATMRKYNINASIIRAIENLYDKAHSAVLSNGSTGEWFRTTVGVRQGCLLSPTLFNIFLERIMCESLKVVSASEDDLLPTSALQMTLS